jgi:hypothetical protein
MPPSLLMRETLLELMSLVFLVAGCAVAWESGKPEEPTY